MSHLSVRLAWHDAGWNGCICNQPHLNSSCIVIENIREAKDNDFEQKVAGKDYSQLNGWLPPCCWTSSVYSPESFEYKHRDPLYRPFLTETPTTIPEYSCLPAPYKWMREEYFQDIIEKEDLIIRPSNVPERDRGWVYEPDRQEQLLVNFWNKVKEDVGKALVFYYVKGTNPVDEEAVRLIVGVGRIKEVGPQWYFNGQDPDGKKYPIWTRIIKQNFPEEGFRLPYQEYIKLGKDPSPFACRVNESAIPEFLFVAEHVSDDTAIGVLEKLFQSVEYLKNDNQVDWDWEKQLDWLNQCLDDVWVNRGPYPGIGSVLHYLGCKQSAIFQKTVLSQKIRAMENPLNYTIAVLERRERILPRFEEAFKNAFLTWRNIQAKPDRLNLLKLLAKIEITPEQVKRIMDKELRKESGIECTEEEIVENPYVICERDLGSDTSEPISVEIIDRGMKPEGLTLSFIDRNEIFDSEDKRRVRGIGNAILKTAADQGDTILSVHTFIERIRNFFPEKRACRPEVELLEYEKKFFEEYLSFIDSGDNHFVTLNRMRDYEIIISETIQARISRENEYLTPNGYFNWEETVIKEFGSPQTDRETRAIKEKTDALDILYKKRISVLMGSAGTGKTTALKIFLDNIESIEGKQGYYLLAPTGKARVRLSSTTRKKAYTIHQLLFKLNWLAKNQFYLKANGGGETSARTIIIDESSMVPLDLLGTLFKALKMNLVSRLILVGDPNQLPPIGPGRPFVDIVAWLKENKPSCIADLKTTMRVVQEEGKSSDSSALALANGYRWDYANPGDDEVLSLIAQQEKIADLEIHFWEDYESLMRALKGSLKARIGLDEKAYDTLNRSFEISNAPYAQTQWKGVENWQILSPTRSDAYGIEELNRYVQMTYRKNLITPAFRGNIPKPFGDQSIVYTDKVIETRNNSRSAYPRNSDAFNYVANGEIGIVVRTQKECLDVGYSTQENYTYRYYRGQVNDHLELAYALTVHKAQGSDFELVYFIIPRESKLLSPELVYTGLTRFRKNLVLLIQGDISTLQNLRSPDRSDTLQRNTNLFNLSLRPDPERDYYPEALINRTKTGVSVRSKSEVIVADSLTSLHLDYQYEEPLRNINAARDFRLPDFTVGYQGDIYYWEHLGMLHLPTYKENWLRKKKWYEEVMNIPVVGDGIDQDPLNIPRSRFLITSIDMPDGGIDSGRIEGLIRKYILCV